MISRVPFPGVLASSSKPLKGWYKSSMTVVLLRPVIRRSGKQIRTAVTVTSRWEASPCGGKLCAGIFNWPCFETTGG